MYYCKIVLQLYENGLESRLTFRDDLFKLYSDYAVASILGQTTAN